MERDNNVAMTYKADYAFYKDMSWLFFISVANLLGTFTSNIIRYSILTCTVLIAIVMITRLIIRSKRSLELQISSQYLMFDSQKLTKDNLASIHIYNNGMITLTKKKGNIFTKAILISLKQKENQRAAIQLLREFCHRNDIALQNEG